MKCTFVVLHYLTYDDTYECIESILHNIEYENYNIVVVDNGSQNNSGEMLEKNYAGNKKVHIVKSKKNLGFAKGNNLGFMYAKLTLKSDFIILINNDTLIEQKNFLSELIEKYKTTPFHVLGPDILSTKDGLHQNPQLDKVIQEPEIKKIILKIKIKAFLNKIGCEELIMNTYFSFKKGGKETNELNNSLNWQAEQENIQLHGACLIFSPDYVNNYNGLYDNTFMYMEEHILFYITNREKLKTLYFPKIRILHKEDSSTDALFNKSNKKRLFVYKNMIASLNELLRIHRDNSIYIENMKD
ncbi:glycosyltransferase family 2 protein [Niallia sp. 03091]|uniref:glycosyltransferase family 2 protein n=1 Tax=Niallia sp. 03091 TaxID=3458059 RepID=UPI004044B920